MPISINNPESFIIDKVKITKFEVTPEFGHVVIHFSRGYENESGEFIAKEFDSAYFKHTVFEDSLYESVKNKLYGLLNSSINPQE